MLTVCTRPKRVDPQSELFETRGVDTMGKARGLVGEFYEWLTAETFGIELFATDSRADICPDGRDPFDRDAWVEIKSIGLSGSAILYDIRLQRDRKLIEQTGKPIRYFFWRHHLSVQESINYSNSVADLWGDLRRATRKLAIVDFVEVENLCATKAPKIMNSGTKIKTGPMAGKPCGYGAKGYDVGWGPTFKDLCRVALHVERFDLFV